mgnify:CR=1 FL=1
MRIYVGKFQAILLIYLLILEGDLINLFINQTDNVQM